MVDDAEPTGRVLQALQFSQELDEYVRSEFDAVRDDWETGVDAEGNPAPVSWVHSVHPSGGIGVTITCDPREKPAFYEAFQRAVRSLADEWKRNPPS